MRETSTCTYPSKLSNCIQNLSQMPVSLGIFLDQGLRKNKILWHNDQIRRAVKYIVTISKESCAFFRGIFDSGVQETYAIELGPRSEPSRGSKLSFHVGRGGPDSLRWKLSRQMISALASRNTHRDFQLSLLGARKKKVAVASCLGEAQQTRQDHTLSRLQTF